MARIKRHTSGGYIYRSHLIYKTHNGWEISLIRSDADLSSFYIDYSDLIWDRTCNTKKDCIKYLDARFS